MAEQPAAVYDCMIYLQAVANPNGPAFRCFEAIEAKRASLLVCPAIMAELSDVLNRPSLRAKLKRLTAERVTEFLERVLAMSDYRPDPANHFRLPRDPDDQVYLDLSIETKATHLVTWNDRHLTYLMRGQTPESQEFRRLFPALTILDPPTFLNAINFASATNGPRPHNDA